MPEPTLQATALRYAAGDLTTAECAAFEVQLTLDQDARDALAEAVRLSAAALGQKPPSPDRSFREAIRERLAGYCPAWLRRRAYRGHPVTWAGIGAGVVAASTLLGLALGGRTTPDSTRPVEIAETGPALKPPVVNHAEMAMAPAPRTDEVPGNVGLWEANNPRSVAEIWANLSTPEHVEKVHEDEQRWRQRLREGNLLHAGRGPVASPSPDLRQGN